MQRITIALVFVLSLGISSANAQINGTFEQITVSSTPIGISAGTLVNMGGCTIMIETNAVRIRYDGSNPSASVGSPITAGASFILRNYNDLSKLRMIRQSQDATAWVNCWPSPGEAGIASAGSAGSESASYDATADALKILPVNSAGVTQTWASDPCASAPESVAIDTAASGSTQLVAISGSTVVYVCGFSAVADAAVTVRFTVGTGSACATSPTNKTGAMSFAANGGASSGNGGATVFKSAAGQALCINLGGAVGVRGVLSYVQQ